MKRFDRRLLAALFFCAALAACAAPRRHAAAPPAAAPAPADTTADTPSAPEPAPVRIPEVIPEAVPLLEAPPIVRVLVADGRQSVRVRIAGAFSVLSDRAGERVARIPRGGDYSVRAAGGDVVLVEGKRRVFSSDRIYVEPEGESAVSIGGSPYRGAFLFAATRGGVAAVNVLDIDEYLKGVLPSEIGYLKPEQFEAFRAQAIAARSYALSKLSEKRGELFDLNATVMDQVYRGASAESEGGNRAVEETRGLVCAFLGEPARAYYCSCCGGHTADIRVSWPWKTPYPYLYGVRDTVPGSGGESLCRGSKHFRWRVRWTAATLGSILRKTIPAELRVSAREVGRLVDVRVLGASLDGRAQGIEIVTDRESFTVQGDRIRWVLKPDPSSDAILRSTLFNIEVSPAGGRVAAVDLLGGGNGHGVGMCQTGAIRMAELGYRGEDIIDHYYPGTRVVTLYR